MGLIGSIAMSENRDISIYSPIKIRNRIFETRLFGSDIISGCFDITAYVMDEIAEEIRRKDINEFSDPEIRRIIELHADAAHTVRPGSARICSVSATTGTLIGDCFSTAANRRTDHWGGSLENRAMLAKCVIDSVRNAAPDDIILEFRISGAEFIPGGYIIEEAVRFAKLIDGKADIIHVTAGVDPGKDHFLHNNPYSGILHGSNIRLASEIRNNVSKSYIASDAGLGDIHLMNSIIVNKKADIIYCPDYPHLP